MKLGFCCDFLERYWSVIEVENSERRIKIEGGTIKHLLYELCETVNIMSNKIKELLNSNEINKKCVSDINLLKDEVFKIKYPDLQTFLKDKPHAIWPSLDPIYRENLRDYLRNKYNDEGVIFTYDYEVPRLQYSVNINGKRTVCFQQIIDECEQVVNELKCNKKGGKKSGRK